MIKFKNIIYFIICFISIFLLVGFSNGIEKNKLNSEGEKQTTQNVSGIYEFKTSWLQSTVDFKSDGTFEMSYTMGNKSETSGTWTIEKDILILKNNHNFPANKKWLIRNEKLYPILKSSKEYDMNFFYISKKENTEKVNSSLLKNCKLKYFENDDNSTYIIIKDNIHIEFPNGGKNYIKSNLEWLNDFEYNATIIELTSTDSPFKIGDKLNVKFEKIDSEIVYYKATFDGEILTGKFKLIK